MFKSLGKWCFGTIATLLIAGTFSVNAQDDVVEEAPAIDGGALFKSKCATCHDPHADGTGPKLSGARAAWEENAAPGMLYQWIKNWELAAAADPYAKTVSAKKPTAMTKFGDLNNDQIDAILDWVDAQPAPTKGGAVEGGGAAGGAAEEEGESMMLWLVLGVVFLVVILGLGSVRRQLRRASGDTADESLSYFEEFRKWAWLNLRFFLLGCLVLFIAVTVLLFQGLYRIGVVEGYQPSQPIEFPHSVHAGVSGIDCKYCHNSVEKSRSAGIPTVNVCMNCHKQIKGSDDQVAKIQKIYDAAGFDPETGTYSKKSTGPIVWNKVHVLPDHVYFNHSQHVVVGGIDCKQCHGDMTKMEGAVMVQPVSELNKIEGNIPLTRPTLTMGWCIECHGETEVGQMAGADYKGTGYYDEIHRRLVNNDRSLYSKYLDDNKVTVRGLGGWECSKCHY